MAKKKLDLNIHRGSLLPQIPVDQTRTIVGTGDAKPKYPADLAGDIVKTVKAGKPSSKKGAVPEVTTDVDPQTFQRSPWLPQALIRPGSLPAKAAVPEYETMIAVAGAFAVDMQSREFDEIMHQLLGNDISIIAGALESGNIPPDTRPGLTEHLGNMRDVNARMLVDIKQAMGQLTSEYPTVPRSKLLDQVMNAVLTHSGVGPFIGVSQGYSHSLVGWADPGTRRELRALNFFIKSQFRLFLTGTLDEIAKEQRPHIPATAIDVTDAILTGYFGPGLATMPASYKGVLRLHQVMIPQNLRGIISVVAGTLGHEQVHQLVAAIQGLLKEIKNKVAAKLESAVKSGALRFSQDTVKIGNWKVPTLQFVTKVYSDWMNEIIADLVGGVANGGPPFAKDMFGLFPALNARDKQVADMPEQMRAVSYFGLQELDEKRIAFSVEAHPTDVIRGGINGAGYDQIDFKSTGDFCRLLSGLASLNGKLPDVVKWIDPSGKSEIEIVVATLDLLACAPFVAETLIDTKLDTIGYAFGQIVRYNEKHLAKTNQVVAALKANKKDLPDGTVHGLYVTGAGSTRIWQIHQEGGDVASAIPEVSARVIDWLNVLADREEEKKAA